MNKKPKRIRAEINRGITRDRDMYVLWRGDIRALAEQITKDYWAVRARTQTKMHPMLFALRRAGMTPGKGTQ